MEQNVIEDILAVESAIRHAVKAEQARCDGMVAEVRRALAAERDAADARLEHERRQTMARAVAESKTRAAGALRDAERRMTLLLSLNDDELERLILEVLFGLVPEARHDSQNVKG